MQRRNLLGGEHHVSPTIGHPVVPVKYLDRINVALQDRTSWNLNGTNWTLETFLAEMKKHSWIKVNGHALVAIAHVCDVRFFPGETDQYGTPQTCAEFEFA